MKKLLLCLTVTGLLAAVESRAEQGGKFDKLTPEDRAVFAERFKKDIWPLMTRSGKDGCAGCHATRKGTLKMSGDAAKDFHMLLGDGYLLKNDPGSVLDRVMHKDPAKRMPPKDKPAWTEAEIKILREFVYDLDKKNKL